LWLPAPEARALGQQIILAESDGSSRRPLETRTAPEVPLSAPIVAPNTTPALASDDPEQRLADHVQDSLRQSIAQALDLDPARLEADRSFSEYGVDSIIAVQLINEINDRLGIVLQTTVLFDYNTLDELCRHIEESHGRALATRVAPPATPAAAPAETAAATGLPYRRLLIDRPGSIEVLRIADATTEPLRPDQVRIGVRAFSLNFSDLLSVKGLYPNMPPYPFTPGMEAAGVVLDVGSRVASVRPGDEVVCLAQACHASIVTGAEDEVLPKPSGIGFEEACALPVVGLTMLEAFDKAEPQPGERILIQTAAGGTGLIAVQLARHAGAEVIATAGSQRKLDYLRDLGVPHLINYRESDFEAEVMRLTGGRGVDVVINTLSGDAIQKGLNCLAPGGRYVEIAMAALKSAGAVDLSVLDGNQSFFSIDLSRLVRTRPHKVQAHRRRLAELVEAGVLTATLSEVFPFERLPDAYRHLEERRNIGKVVVRVPAPEDQHDRSSEPTTEPMVRTPEPVAAAADEAIAVVGMAGRFARSDTVEAFWEHLVAGTDLVEDVTRWDLGPRREGQCRAGSLLERIDTFDPLFFRMSGLEATYMDPQQRLFLEEAWRALEDAGYAGEGVRGKRCGVYVGCASGDYWQLFTDAAPAQAFWGNAGSVIPARIAYHLDLQGPAVAVDTACSSSLVALHLACQGLRAGDADMAIAGGVFLQATSGFYASATPAGMLSPSGRCHTFDKAADGFVPGEGVGAVVLKRLGDALADGDHVHAVIRGSGINQDGHTNGITAPSALSQERLERQVYDRFAIEPETLQLVEAHGTGTRLGDPIEFQALTKAFRHDTDRQGFCALGSVKTNIGHLAAAAGIASVIKVLLALRHGQIPPSLHFQEANPAVRFEDSPFYVNASAIPWPATPDRPRRAAVSSFGFSGTNAHLVIEEAPALPVPSPARPAELVVLSARTARQLRCQVENLIAHCRTQGGIDLGQIAFTLLVGREHREHRLACIVRSTAELVDMLERWLRGEAVAGIEVGELEEGGPREQIALRHDGNAAIDACRPARDPATVQGHLRTISERYLAGYRLDYANLFVPGRRRLPLPTYPFARERYWVDSESAPEAALPQAAGPMAPTAPPAVDVQPSSGVLRNDAIAFVKSLVAKTLRVPPTDISASAPLESYGIDSILVVQITEALRQHFPSVSNTLLFEVQTVAALVDYLLEAESTALTRLLDPAAKPTPAATAPLASMTAPSVAEVWPVPRPAGSPGRDAEIAVVGLSGRYPKAPDVAAFWDNLRRGRDCIDEVPPERWDWRAYFDPERGKPGHSYTRWGGFLEGVDRFDPRFFRIPPSEAAFIDPQERLFLETAWASIEDAGYAPETLGEGGRVGVFVGVMNSLYLPQASHWSIANRVSYLLDFTGPSLAVDTACSSSLTAIHLAMESLRAGTCAAAVVGGVNLILHPLHITNLTGVGMLSSGPHCRAFGDGADGFVDGEGVGALVLKPLGRAIADGDHVYGLLKCSMINAGGKTNGYTVPNPLAQAQVIREALARAEIDPASIGYVEAHGTGTALGDPIEIRGLAQALGAADAEGARFAIGSVKSNIGHCESAAGIAGVTKVLLQMRHGQLAPTLHAERLNPKIDFAGATITVQRRLEHWPRPDGQPRRAGVSSFGAGGANAHLVVEEYVAAEAAPTARAMPAGQPAAFLLSAANADRLVAAAGRLAAFLGREEAAALNLFDVAYTLQVGRRPMAERLAFTATSLADARDRLAAFAEDASEVGIVRGTAQNDGDGIAGLADDRELGETVEKWMRRGKYDELFGLWVRGFPVDWNRLYGEVRPRRVGLPTYPFAGEAYWAPEAVRYAGLVSSAPEPTAPETDLLLCHPVWRDAPIEATEAPIAPVRRVVLLGVDPALAELGELLQTSERDPAAACSALYEQLFLLLKGLLTDPPGVPVLLQVVVPGAGEGALLSGVSGMLLSAGQESRKLIGQVIRLEGDEDVETLRRRLAENAAAPEAPVIRYRQGRRQVRMLEERQSSAATVPWKDGGVYLLTGGTGALGLLFAEEIARRTRAATLVLTGRSALSKARAQRLAAIEESGARVVYERVDVADREEVTQTVRRLVAAHGGLDGVLHIAGVLRDSYIVKKGVEAFREVLAAKLSGTANLDLATRDLDLDLFLLFSSGAAVFGNLGQADYAAANAFMDAYAAWRGAGALSVDWPLWAEGGMDMDAATREMMLTTAGMVPMPAEIGFQALYRAIAAGEPQALAVHGEPGRLRQTLLAPAAVERAKHHPDSIGDAVLAAVAELLELDPEEIGPEQDLGDFGVDSIGYTRLANRLNQAYGYELRPSDFLECRSVADIAAYLQETDGPPVEVETPPAEAPASQPGHWPLSEGQQGLWLLQQAEPDSSSYNVPIAFRVEADFDPAAFRGACAALWNHADSLRTLIGSEDGVPYQTIAAAGEPPFYVEDVSRLPETEIEAYVAEVAKTPFHLSGPLMRVHLFTRTGGRTTVLITIHHIVFDGVSAALLLRWLLQAYQAIRRSETPSLPRAPATYGDFVAWERGMLAESEGGRHLDYWRDHLAGELPRAMLPFDHPRPAVPEVGGRTLRLELNPELVQLVRRAAREFGVGVSVVFLAVFKVLLSKYGGQEDIIVGMPTMGRQQQRFEAVIGYFVNVIALRSRIAPEHSLRSVARELKGTVLRGLDHAAYPFPALVRALKVKRAEGLTPVYQVAYAFQNAAEVVAAPGWEMLDGIHQEGDTEFGLEVVEAEAGYVLHLAYNGDRFEARTIDRMARQYLVLLAEGLERPDRPVAELSLLSAGERRRLLRSWTPAEATAAVREPVTETFSARATAMPEAPALLDAETPGRTMSYRELSDRAEAVAARLRKAGVKPGDRVGLFLRCSFGAVVGLLGALKAGAVYVPLDPDHPQSRISFILSDCGIRVLLVDKVTLARLPAPAREDLALVNLDAMRRPSGRSSRRPAAAIEPGDAAYVIYTSGSTGRPKGVQVSHRALAEHCRVIAEYYELSPEDRVLQFASPSVDTSLEQILPGLLVGTCIVVRGDRVWTVNEFNRVVAATGITVADLPPSYLREVLQAWKGADFDMHKRLRLVIVGGEAVTPDTVCAFRESPLGRTRLVNAYGPTEATVTCLVCDLTAEDWTPEVSANVPIGRPLANTRACVLDRHGQPVPEGVAGELFVGGPRIADGYVNRSELTRARFVPDPLAMAKGLDAGPILYATGDMVRYIPGRQGLVEFIGRTDQQIKVRGFRVE
ncbi:MAG: amino acid adenylation domain-containing protein, partial [Alphaproteobacteria bacterium]|nr:amino acid adenylation domain-containing protein [Alphaproteobacteria bacterium]